MYHGIMYLLIVFQAVLSGNTEVPARNLHQHIQNLMQTDPGDNVTPMELEFKNLANVKAEPARYIGWVSDIICQGPEIIYP